MRTRLAAIGILVIAALTVPLTSAFGGSATQTQTLTLSVTSGVPGSSFTVSALASVGPMGLGPISGCGAFGPFGTATAPDPSFVRVDVNFSPTPVHQEFTANNDGSWSTTITVPTDTVVGEYAVTATCTQATVGEVGSLDVTYSQALYTVVAAPVAAAPEAVVAAPRTTG
jgi:hypothetical protein